MFLTQKIARKPPPTDVLAFRKPLECEATSDRKGATGKFHQEELVPKMPKKRAAALLVVLFFWVMVFFLFCLSSGCYLLGATASAVLSCGMTKGFYGLLGIVFDFF